MRVGVVTFPGSLDDGDATRAVRLAEVHQMAEPLLSNPVIENFTVRVVDA